MVVASVDLGSIEVARKKPRVSLTLSTSFTIALPPSWSEPPTADELHQASSAGRIWVSKAGSCHVEVLTLINDERADSVLEPNLMATIVNLVSECSVSSASFSGRDRRRL